MRCKVHPKLNRGMHMPRSWYVRQRMMPGMLIIKDVRDQVRKRYVRVARVIGDDGADVLLPLYGAEVIAVNADWMVITGIERHEDAARVVTEYAQSWWVVVSNAGPSD